MIRRPKYLFNKDLKKEFLQGRNLKYVADKVGISYSYITSIVQGRNTIDEYLINEIMLAIGYTNKDINNDKYSYFSKDI